MKAYEIDIFRLSNQEHRFEFEIGSDYFQEMDQDLVEHGEVKALAVLDKNDRFIELNLHLEGFVELICDRSLDEFNFPIEGQHRMIFKYGDREEELSDEMVMITSNTQHINIGQLLFEFIAVSIPMKKLHPRFDDQGDDHEEQLVYRSDSDQSVDDNATDPRWGALKGLKKGQ